MHQDRVTAATKKSRYSTSLAATQNNESQNEYCFDDIKQTQIRFLINNRRPVVCKKSRMPAIHDYVTVDVIIPEKASVSEVCSGSMLLKSRNSLNKSTMDPVERDIRERYNKTSKKVSQTLEKHVKKRKKPKKSERDSVGQLKSLATRMPALSNISLSDRSLSPK